ncbi:hypothetical protein BC567DRAFT_238738 [Phyllosticta citribraziliensis]
MRVKTSSATSSRRSQGETSQLRSGSIGLRRDELYGRARNRSWKTASRHSSAWRQSLSQNAEQHGYLHVARVVACQVVFILRQQPYPTTF